MIENDENIFKSHISDENVPVDLAVSFLRSIVRSTAYR